MAKSTKSFGSAGEICGKLKPVAPRQWRSKSVLSDVIAASPLTYTPAGANRLLEQPDVGAHAGEEGHERPCPRCNPPCRSLAFPAGISPGTSSNRVPGSHVADHHYLPAQLC